MKTRIAALVLALAAPLLADPKPAADPFLGTWVLDTAKSKYLAGTCPKRMTIEMTGIANGVHYRSETVLESGKTFAAEYTATYDGAPAAVSGAKGILLPVTLQRVNPREVIARYASGLEVRATSRRTVSPDGETMTVTTTSGNGSGATFTNTGTYHRDRPTLHTYLTQSATSLP